MCNPAIAMVVVTAVSAAYSGYSQHQQGKYQKSVADYNAAVAENEAQEVRDAGTEAENKQRRKTAELLSKQRAQLGAANVDLSSGSALQLQEDTLALGEADALRIRSNYEHQSASLMGESSLISNKGEAAESAGNTAAVGSLLQGGASIAGSGVADKWFTSSSAAMNLSATANQGKSILGTSTVPSF